MKKFSVVLATLALAIAALSTPALAAIEVTGDAYIGYYDKYLWRGYNLSGSLPVVQGGVDLSAKGFTLSYWTNIQTKTDDGEGFIGGEATENDLTINYAIPVGEIATVNVGNIYYMLDGLEDTHEAYLGVTLAVPLSPTVKAYYDWDESDKLGLFYTASVSHSLPINDMVSLSASALVSYNDESDYSVGDYNAWHNYELSAKADFKVTEQLTISPSFLYSSPISDEAKDRIDSEVLGGVNVLFTF